MASRCRANAGLTRMLRTLPPRPTNPAGCFGELALLHGCPRAATVAAGPGGGRLWALDRAAFRGILVGGAAARRLRREAILRGCEALADLTPAQVAAAADCLVAEGFAAGEAILTEGEGVGPEAKFYVLESGEVHAFRTVNVSMAGRHFLDICAQEAEGPGGVGVPGGRRAEACLSLFF